MMKSALLPLLLILPLLFILHPSNCDPAATPPPAPDKNDAGTAMAPPGTVKADAATGKDHEGAIKKNDGADTDRKQGSGRVKDEKPVMKAEEGKGKGGGSGSGGGEADKKKIGAEECDPSNRCVDEKNKLVACLRVPGEDLLDLSLLVQNKGTGTLDVTIVAPRFVNLENARVQLQSKENKEIKVSVQDGVNGTVIVLRAGEGNCSLNFRNMISNSVKRSETSTLAGYNKLSTSYFIIGIFLATVILFSVAWLCIRHWRRSNPQDGGPGYQKVEMGLSLSSGGKKEADETGGWDNSWGDSWDDEEAPMTPSSSVLTPSSKGLASRKSSKDSWKD